MLTGYTENAAKSTYGIFLELMTGSVFNTVMWIQEAHLHFSNLEDKVLLELFHLFLILQLLSGISGLSFQIKETQQVGPVD